MVSAPITCTVANKHKAIHIVYTVVYVSAHGVNINAGLQVFTTKHKVLHH